MDENLKRSAKKKEIEIGYLAFNYMEVFHKAGS